MASSLRSAVVLLLWEERYYLEDFQYTPGYRHRGGDVLLPRGDRRRPLAGYALQGGGFELRFYAIFSQGILYTV